MAIEIQFRHSLFMILVKDLRHRDLGYLSPKLNLLHLFHICNIINHNIIQHCHRQHRPYPCCLHLHPQPYRLRKLHHRHHQQPTYPIPCMPCRCKTYCYRLNSSNNKNNNNIWIIITDTRLLLIVP